MADVRTGLGGAFPGDLLQQEIITDYWAARCLKPGRKVRWALVLESAQGAGKGMMKLGLSTMLGWRNCGDFGPMQMTDQYDSWRVSAANLFGEEIGFPNWSKARESDRVPGGNDAEDGLTVLDRCFSVSIRFSDAYADQCTPRIVIQGTEMVW